MPLLNRLNRPLLPLFGAFILVTACGKKPPEASHCADIYKFKSGYYSVIIRPIASSKCKLGQRVGFTRQERLGLIRAENEEILKIYRKIPACGNEAQTLRKQIDSLTLNNFCKTPECASDLAWSSYLASLMGIGPMSRRFAGIDDGYPEAISSIRKIYDQIGVAESVAEAGRMATPEEYTLLEALNRASDPVCRNAVLESERHLFDSIVIERYDSEKKVMTGVSASGTKPSAIKELIVPQASCVYGPASPEGERCATLNDAY